MPGHRIPCGRVCRATSRWESTYDAQVYFAADRRKGNPDGTFSSFFLSILIEQESTKSKLLFTCMHAFPKAQSRAAYHHLFAVTPTGKTHIPIVIFFNLACCHLLDLGGVSLGNMFCTRGEEALPTGGMRSLITVDVSLEILLRCSTYRFVAELPRLNLLHKLRKSWK